MNFLYLNSCFRKFLLLLSVFVQVILDTDRGTWSVKFPHDEKWNTPKEELSNSILYSMGNSISKQKIITNLVLCFFPVNPFGHELPLVFFVEMRKWKVPDKPLFGTFLEFFFGCVFFPPQFFSIFLRLT